MDSQKTAKKIPEKIPGFLKILHIISDSKRNWDGILF